MGGALFAFAFFFAAGVLVWRASLRRLRAATQPTTFIITRFDEVPGLIRRYRCPCGRSPDERGESPTSQGTSVQLECVCGRRDRLTFVLAN